MAKTVKFGFIESKIAAFIFTLLLFFSFNAWSQLLFFADFEGSSKTKAFPDLSVNDLKNWESTPKIEYSIEEGPNGTNELKVLTEGCEANGTTLLPDPRGTNESWTDVIIELEAVWGDDDDLGIIFRRKADDKGYIALFGGTQDPTVYLVSLDESCVKDGVCLFQACIGDAMEKKEHRIPEGITYKIRIEAIGDSIKLYSWNPEEVDKQEVDPIIEVRDSTYKSGTVGIRPESWSNGFIDNIMVTGPAGPKAVRPEGKMAISWGRVKALF